MNLLGFIKDIILLPVNIVLDVTLITPAIKIIGDDDTETPFGTIDRIESMINNIEQTKN